MNTLNSREIVVLKYINGDHEYVTDGPNTFMKVPKGFTEAQFTYACDTLAEKGMIQTAYCEGHVLQDARVLPHGKAYLDNLAAEQEKNKEESAMKKSLLDCLRVGKGNRRTTYWHNGVCGQIIDLDSVGEFHLIDYIDDKRENPVYLSDVSEKKNSKILAKGLVGYLLNQYITGRLTDIEAAYRNYAEKCFEEFDRGARLDPHMMNRNHKLIFFKFQHDDAEKRKIKESEAIYPYLTELDVYWIEECVKGYWEFIEEYKKINCKPKPFTLDSFMSLFSEKGLASKCLLWMDEKNDIHPSFSKWSLTGVNTEQLSNEIIKGSDEIDFDAFRTGKEPFLEEIETILKRNDANEINSKMEEILGALDSFSSKLYPLAKCKSCITKIHKYLEGNKNIDLSTLLQLENHNVKYFKLLLDYSLIIDEYKEKYIYYWDIELYTKKYIELYYRFVRNLDYLLMRYGKDLLDYQKDSGVYLMKPNDEGDIADACQWNTYKTICSYFEKLPNRKKNMKKEEKIMNFLVYPYLEEEDDDDAEKEERKESTEQKQETESSKLKTETNVKTENDVAGKEVHPTEKPSTSPINKPSKSIKDSIIANNKKIKKNIYDKLCEFIKGNEKPKDILRPLRAAIDAGCIQKPDREVFNQEFTYKISRASWNRYTAGNDHPYKNNVKDSTYEGYLREFQTISNP